MERTEGEHRCRSSLSRTPIRVLSLIEQRARRGSSLAHSHSRTTTVCLISQSPLSIRITKKSHLTCTILTHRTRRFRRGKVIEPRSVLRRWMHQIPVLLNNTCHVDAESPRRFIMNPLFTCAKASTSIVMYYLCRRRHCSAASPSDLSSVFSLALPGIFRSSSMDNLPIPLRCVSLFEWQE